MSFYEFFSRKIGTFSPVNLYFLFLFAIMQESAAECLLTEYPEALRQKSPAKKCQEVI